ncbi:MAG: ferredoxin [Planctomycetota bacterium]|nr:MAG: ferredoxin [Planctomycetota bacterium]
MTEATASIEIDRAWCKCCYLCISVCPADVYARSDYIGERGVAVPLVARPEKCVRCGLCELMCPDMAVTVRDKTDKPRKKSGG